MRKIDVAHQAESPSETARHQKVEAGQRHAVENGADEGLLANQQPLEPGRPDPEQHPQQGDAQKECDRRPALTGGEGGRHRGRRQAHALIRRRCSDILGALWNWPSFMMARSRLLSCNTRMFAIGSPSTSSMSAK